MLQTYPPAQRVSPARLLTLLMTMLLIGSLLIPPAHAQTPLARLHNFGNDGAIPGGHLVFGSDGQTLYGMTLTGGSQNQGVLFQITADGTYTVLHNFMGGIRDGAVPEGDLTVSGTILYGMTFLGGANSGGIIFSYDTAKTPGAAFTDLHDFGSASPIDGYVPVGNLTLVGHTLYGTTQQGGTNGYTSRSGTLFAYDTTKTGAAAFTVLHSFADGSDGVRPQGSLIVSGRLLYGTASEGGASDAGVLFAYDTSQSAAIAFTVLHTFSGGSSDGYDPRGPLALSGSTLYGMTDIGGASNLGTLFSYDTALSGAGAFTVLHSFVGDSGDGASPLGGVTVSGSTLYGTTSYGGAFNLGTLFSYDTTHSGASAMTLLHQFTGGHGDGEQPVGLTLRPDGQFLYGMTSLGGNNNQGILYSFALNGPVTTAAVSPSTPNGSHNWYTLPVTVTLAAKSPTLPITTYYALNESTWHVYSAPITVSADGRYGLTYLSVSPYTNNEIRKRVNFFIDGTAPVTVGSALSAQVTLSATDNLSGVSRTYYSVDGGSVQTYWKPFGVPGASAHTITFHSTDNAGNVEATKTLSVPVAGTPTTTATLSPATPNGANGWYTVPVTITFSAASPTSPLETYYRLDGGPYVLSRALLTISSDAKHGMDYHSQSPYTNAEPLHRLYVPIDATAPVTTGSASGAQVTLSATDAVSGVATTVYSIDGGSARTYSAPFRVSSGSHTVTYHSMDKAGNIEATKTLTASG